jgi:hypothetical protein
MIIDAKDNDGRKGRSNHTILIPIKQYIAVSHLDVNWSFTVPKTDILEPLEV